jgi:hypothetical protein
MKRLRVQNKTLEPLVGIPWYCERCKRAGRVTCAVVLLHIVWGSAPLHFHWGLCANHAELEDMEATEE